MAQKIKVEFVNHEGAGFSDATEVEIGTSIGEFFAAKMPNKSPSAYTILVNRDNVPRGYLLRDGDRVSITPTKVQGAGAR